jgi:indolepyruvate ferredoxin oxidoreductase
MELNAVAVLQNQTAFEWGRHAAHDAAALERGLQSGQVVTVHKRPSLEALIARRVEFLTGYQNAAYAQSYQAFVDKVRQWDERVGKQNLALTEAVAKGLFKLMAYKDEYEVARLHSDGVFQRKIEAMFEGDFTLHYHLAPPLLAKKNEKGELQKQHYGPALLTAFKLLARLKGLRGTALDIFGWTPERRQERALIGEYRASVEEVMQVLDRMPRFG